MKLVQLSLRITFALWTASVPCTASLGQVLPVESDSIKRSVQPLPNAHAHNDYEHPRPLLDALEQGFTSIEADVFLVDGQLLVAHNLKDVSLERTLDNLYLRPLYERFQSNAGWVFSQPSTITLLVDIKRDGEAVYAELHRQLSRYTEMISVTVDGQFIEKAVTVIVSGDRPVASMAASNPRYAGIDGRIADLAQKAEANKDLSLMPLISDNWRLHFRYRGDGPMSEADREKLQQIASSAHQQGRRLRFWATPDSEELWQELLRAGVDLIGTDDLKRLATFLRR